MKEKIFVSHADIILDKIYDSNFKLIKQDGGGCNWNNLYNLSLLGEKCYAFGTAGNDEEGKIAIESLKRAGVNTDNVLIDNNISTAVMNIIMPENEAIGDNDVFHTWYSPITNKNTMHFSDNLPLYIPKDFNDKDIYIILDKFESINFDFINRIKNKKVCLDVGDDEFIEYYTNQYLLNFFKTAKLMQLNCNICDYLFNKLKIKDEIEFFNLLNLDLMIITKGKKGARFIYRRNGEISIIDKVPKIIVDAVDTSGAGDAFYSIFIREYAYSDMVDEDFINHTFDKANQFSREVISQVGSRK